MRRRPSDMNWDDLKFFLAVARAGSLHRAARDLMANRTTISRRLESLETSIEAKLFFRRRAGLELTALGHELVPHAEKMEEEIASVARRIASSAGVDHGMVRLSMPHFFARTFIMDILTEFADQNPDIQLRIDLNRAIANLDHREADVSLRYAHEVSDDVVGRKLGTAMQAVYCSPNLVDKITEQSGAGLHWIGTYEPEGDITADWIARSPFPDATLRHRMTEGAPLIAMMKAGAGLAMLPCFVGDTISGLVRTPFQTIRKDKDLWLLLHQDMRNDPRVRKLVEFLAKHTREHRNKLKGSS